MFGYSLPLLFGRLFGVPLFVLGIIFLRNYRHDDRPKDMLKKALRSGWVWLALVLTWIAFGFEIAYIANKAAVS
jgi:hypothetical protein